MYHTCLFKHKQILSHCKHSLKHIHYSVKQVVSRKDADFPFQTETVTYSYYRRAEMEKERNRLLYSRSPFIILESRKRK